MRLTDSERMFVRSLPRLAIESRDGKRSYAMLVAKDGTIDTVTTTCEIARNIAGHTLYADYAVPSTTETMTSWSERWPSLAGNIDALNQVDRRAGHLMWLGARHQRRFAK